MSDDPDTVHERLESFPFDTAPRVFRRRAELLLGPPAGRGPKRHRDHPPIEVVHFPPEYVEQGFAPPRDVYAGPLLRVEWQTMDGRQPFYHRNCAVDEMSYQVAGHRTLMSDLGTVELVPGDFSRLPVGAAHDNYGRRDIHLLFYVPAPVTEAVAADRESAVVIPPFDGWEPGTVNEMITGGLSGPATDVVLAPADELTLLEQARNEDERLRVLRPGDGTTWLYRSAHVLLGHVRAAASDGRTFRRVRDADEVQYQIGGTRTLVTQRGTVLLEPGDFVRVPAGVAFADIHHEESTHLVVSTSGALERVADAAKHAEPLTPAEIGELR